MRESRLRTRWEQGTCAINGWLLSPSLLGAELIGSLAWDSILIDTQHGAIDSGEVYALCVALSGSAATPIVRVPANDPSMIMKSLDAGAYGIMCPMVNGRKDAEAFVRACRYPPRGERSFGPIRATLYGGPDYFERADETIVTLAQIETADALERIEEIVEVPGLDAVYIGSADLSISFGGPAAIDYGDADVVERHQRIVAAAHAAGVRVGMHALSAEDARRIIGWGADLVSVASDMTLMMGAASQLLTEVLSGARAPALEDRPGQPGTPYVTGKGKREEVSA